MGLGLCSMSCRTATRCPKDDVCGVWVPVKNGEIHVSDIFMFCI